MIYEICGIKFSNFILNASGCWASNENKINELFNSNLGGIVSKSISINPKLGNKSPNYYYDQEKQIHFNSKGLPNLGYNYLKKISKNFEKNPKPFILSVAFTRLDELEYILIDYDKSINYKSLVEINLSCPNVDARIPGYHIKDIKCILDLINSLNLKNIVIGLKLPPYFELEKIKKIVNLLNRTDLNLGFLGYIVLANTIPNGLILKDGIPVLSNIYGGISGKFNKYITLSNIYSFRNKYKLNQSIKIIGCGGIETEDDVYDYLKVGADFIQLGSCFYNSIENKLNIEKINNLINRIFYKKKFLGKL